MAVRPPRKGPKLTYTQWKDQLDYFEHRIDLTTNEYYLINPYTGESVMDLNVHLNRRNSLWKKPDMVPGENLGQTSTTLLPLFYASRTFVKCRSVPLFDTQEKAAVVIGALVRGFLGRMKVRNIYRVRFYKEYDNDRGFYYFYDTKTGSTSWNKPFLAWPRDIREKPDPDYVPNDWNGYSSGPAVTKTKMGKGDSTIKKYIRPIPEVEVEIPPEPKPIDFESVSYPIATLWLDTQAPLIKTMDHLQDLFKFMQLSDWDGVIDIMTSNPDNDTLKYLGLHALSRMEVHGSNNVLAETECFVLDYLVPKLRESHGQTFGTTQSFFIVAALNNLLSTRDGRLEFFRVSHLPESEQNIYLEERLSVFLRFLSKIPVEFTKIRKDKLSQEFVYVTKATRKGVDFAEILLKLIAQLAYEPDTRDLLAEYASGYVCKAMLTCIDEQAIVVQGLRCLYNFCYLNEVGQMCVIETEQVPDILKMIRSNDLASDYEVQYEARKVELSLLPGGFRGFVEEKITEELAQKKLRVKHET